MSIRVYRELRDLEAMQMAGVVLAIGNFDGVHRGHQAIFAVGRQRARVVGSQMVAMMFEPHPATVLAPDRVPASLTPLDEKLRCLEAAGVDVAVVIEPRPELLNCPAETFIRDVIVGRFRPIAMVEGDSFRFGQHRIGDVEMLAAAGKQFGFELFVVPPVRVDLGGQPDTVISSSLIRHLLASGTVDRAAECLGRPYALLGRVTHGAARGRTLGFATANLTVESRQLIPAEGVYAGQTTIDDRDYLAAVSIGHAPTFDGHETIVEAHLLDFNGDLYDRPLRLELTAWLRPQQKFESADALKHQIQADRDRILARASNPT
ncbi:MAG: bifunctional riboflavin kinase/FAD synthetase, partial [Phycisphaerae bacterium]|nr:bifunctional riboflavin kinase/FAD synthetase [Phycisphaerae bacterium]